MKWVYVLERSVANIDHLADRPLICRLGIFTTHEEAYRRLNEWASGSRPEGHEKLMTECRIVAEPLVTEEAES